MSVYAPYNFVPLSKWIYQPDWANQVSHDVPFSDGISGSLELEIKAHSPLLVGDDKQQQGTEARPGEVKFFQLPDGRYAIPGTSLKGMLRNVLEIATYGKMRMVDDKWLSVRDLNGEFYRKHLAENLGNNTYRPLAHAGWLELTDNSEWQLTACEYVRVEQDHLIPWGMQQHIDNSENIKKEQNAISKYQLFTQRCLNFDIENQRHWKHQKGRITLEYAKAKSTLGTGEYAGEIVFTGQPSRNNGQSGRKHMEFIFYNNDSTSKIVDETVMQAFLKIHEDSKEWQHWYKEVRQEEKVPVFYLANKAGKITSLGLAMMYRLPYKNSIVDTIDHTNPDHRRSDLFDLPELMFGNINDDNSQFSLKSRVSFGMAYLKNKVKIRRDLPTTILSGPKSSYYPAYVQQKVSKQITGRNPDYKTYMNNDAEISGWKRYPINPRWEMQPLPRDLKATNKVKVNLYPLDTGARFKCDLNIHNLRPAELGALIWGLTWGGNSKFLHSLGMGKPFGLGQISIKIKAENLFSTNPQVSVPNRESCLKTFQELMETAWLKATKGKGTWAESEQLTQLLAMANPDNAPGDVEELAYMPTPKDFQDQKKDGWILPPYHKYTGIKDKTLFKRLTTEEREREKLRKENEQRILDEKIAKQKALENAAEKFDSEIERELSKELLDAPNQSEKEKVAGAWITKMELHEVKAEQRKLAEMLKEFYESIGKWQVKKVKQKLKVTRIKKFVN
jgi:CRISPR-associated protein (TIGR03986 family)